MVTEFREIKKYKNQGKVIPVLLAMPADLLTPVSAYLRAAQAGKKGERESFLLECMEMIEGNPKPGRFSYIGVNPFCSLFIQDGCLNRRDAKGSSKQVEGNPFKTIGKIMKNYPSVSMPGLPPFAGGAIGYLGSECYQYLEDLPVAKNRVAPYDAHLILFRTMIAFDHLQQRILLIQWIFPEDGPLEIAYQKAVKHLHVLRNRLGRAVKLERAELKNLSLRPNSFDVSCRRDEKNFKDSVAKVKKYIQNGDVFQCVLSKQFTFPFKREAFSVYRKLRKSSPSPYLFYLKFIDETLLGASPEMLIRVEKGTVQTCPIAGTTRRGKDEKEDRKLEAELLGSEKEKAEHLMLVDLGRNDVGRIARPRSVSVRRFMEVQRFSNVMHLVSHVEGKLKRGKTAWDALEACFPAGTLSGAPKVRALQLIAELERSQRGPYGGAVVFHDYSGRLDSCITIRSLFIRKGRGLLQAGAGIVSDSHPDREFQEIMNKSKALREALRTV